ncbi:hypothetical protein BT69DRAFT_591985 [Atractiella rhizophila]|nr:hypothetical protein BT69DRAFT_591985 [Atractiella rhizophila]
MSPAAHLVQICRLLGGVTAVTRCLARLLADWSLKRCYIASHRALGYKLWHINRCIRARGSVHIGVNGKNEFVFSFPSPIKECKDICRLNERERTGSYDEA